MSQRKIFRTQEELVNFFSKNYRTDKNCTKILFSHIKKGTNLDYQDEFGMTVLMNACKYHRNLGYTELAIALIKSNQCDIDLKNIHGETALMIACKFLENDSKLKLIKNFIKNKNCDINAQNNYKETTLMILIKTSLSSVKIAKKIFNLIIYDKKCNLNIKDNHGHTALHMTCFYQGIVYFQLLIENENCQLDNLDIDLDGRYYSIFVYRDLIKKEKEKRKHKRNAIGVLFMSKNENNPFRLLPRELIHLILSFYFVS